MACPCRRQPRTHTSEFPLRMTTLETAEPAPTDAEVCAPVPGTDATTSPRHGHGAAAEVAVVDRSQDHRPAVPDRRPARVAGHRRRQRAHRDRAHRRRFDSSIDDGIVAAVRRPARRPRVRCRPPAGPRTVRGDRAAAARCPLDRLPPPRRPRLLALARRPGPEHRLADRQRRLARRQRATWSTCSSPASA